MILGLGSLPLIFLCLGIVTGIAAIILGIIGLVAVSNGQGRVKGKGMAWTGIVSALAAFAIYGLFINKVVKDSEAVPASDRSQKSDLSAARSKVMSSRNGTAHGNTGEAKALAAQFAATMKSMHFPFFEREGDAPKISLTDGEFVTFCQLSEAGCAFILHVPGDRKHTGDAKGSLAELAWMVAITVAEKNPEIITPETPIAVGLRGTILYGAILTGKVGDEAPMAHASTDDEVLASFFPVPEVEEEPVPDLEATEPAAESVETEEE